MVWGRMQNQADKNLESDAEIGMMKGFASGWFASGLRSYSKSVYMYTHPHHETRLRSIVVPIGAYKIFTDHDLDFPYLTLNSNVHFTPSVFSVAFCMIRSIAPNTQIILDVPYIIII